MNHLQLYAKYLLFFSKITSTSSRPRNKTVNSACLFVAVCVFVALIYGGVNGLNKSYSNQNVFGMLWTGGYVYTFSLYIIIILKRHEMGNVIETLNNSFYLDEEIILTKKTTIQSREVNFSLILMKFYIALTQLVFFVVLYYVAKKQTPLLFDVDFPILPIDISGYVTYAVLFVQVVSTQFIVFILSYFMLFYFGICNILTGNLEILCAGYRNTYRTAADRKQGLFLIQNEMTLILKENIKYHQTIIRFFADFNSVSGWLVTAMYVFEQIAICFTVFLTHQSIKTADGGLIRNIALIVISCSHTAFILWSGDRAFTQSKKVQYAVYENMWYNQNKSFKSSVSIVLEYCKRPMLIAAVPIIPANLASIEKILGAAFSYYNLLVALSKD